VITKLTSPLSPILASQMSTNLASETCETETKGEESVSNG